MLLPSDFWQAWTVNVQAQNFLLCWEFLPKPFPEQPGLAILTDFLSIRVAQPQPCLPKATKTLLLVDATSAGPAK